MALPGGWSTSCASNGIRRSTGDESPATVTRQLLTVNGRPPRKGDKPECMDPRSVSPEPLAFLLPDRRHKFAFTGAGIGRVDGREALMVDYRSLEPGKPRSNGPTTASASMCPALARPLVGRSARRAAIVRLDEQLIGMVDLPIPRKHQRVNGALFMTLERADMSIRYRPVHVQRSGRDAHASRGDHLVIDVAEWRIGGQPRHAVVQQLSALRDRRADRSLSPITSQTRRCETWEPVQHDSICAAHVFSRLDEQKRPPRATSNTVFALAAL